jgi:MFS family permease
MRGGPGLLSSLKHRDFRLLMFAFTGSSIGSWAYNVALAVWIFDETGSAAWVGAATIARFVPAFLFSPYGGVVADRYERVRLMVVIDVLGAALMLLMAVEAALSLPVVVVIATAAVNSVLSTAYEPAVAALTPQLVGERDLGSANALRNTIDNVAVVVGPGLGALVLLLGSPPLAIAINSLSYAISAVLVRRIRERSQPVDVTEGGEAGTVQQMLVGVKAIASSPVAAVLVAYSVVATLVFGIDTVLFVVLSRDVLGTGAEGYGYLLAGLGVGGVLGAGLVTRLERRRRLSMVILAGMAVYCLPTLLFFVVSSPVVAFFLQGVRGAGTLVVDVLAITALQRSLPREVLARVFGAFDSMVIAAVVVGAMAAPAIIGSAGLSAMLWISGLVIPLVCLLGLPALRAADRQAEQREAALAPRIQLLLASDLFAAVPEGAVDQLAGAAEEIDLPAGTVVVREGDPAEAFYVVMAGRLEVTARGEGDEPRHLNSLGAGDYFGEIGLIERIPRTATVTVTEPAHLLRCDGEAFLAALTELTPSLALLENASRRLSRTHPAHSMSHPAATT